MPNKEQTEVNLKMILEEIRNNGYETAISKTELIRIINKFTLNPYPYINRLQIDNYIALEPNDKIYKIISLEYKGENNSL